MRDRIIWRMKVVTPNGTVLNRWVVAGDELHAVRVARSKWPEAKEIFCGESGLLVG